ncbi:major facilitator superfamily-related transporter, putative [Plasmodium chabaudi chabaudi]|uniref:Major facilitator superfamily-related transporter, putative n=1 Tax=Plasmodium chabaudi chabaudi TaxID=31271 RepID=A0A4V0K035_PLACU|nr:major facilitator superfamily-related transporter, putative [Plasmodium chabaudi chabaudi]VTZ66312.1 major facilitator superfamily-related transporter, putative [Plasmodium chabaudi chabaudi]|eukprot:XP_016653029.1 organic anion transporter, putative [Plasmodium chabaudi chabaudi]
MENKRNEDINYQINNETKSTLKMDTYEQNCINNNFSKSASILLTIEDYIKKLRNKANNFFFIYIIVTTIHLLLYANRGVLSGSYDYLSSHFKSIYPEGNVDVHIGFLISIFIYGASINSIVSGSLAYKHDPFKITAIFLFQGAIALALASIFFVVKSHYGLIFSRFYCGFCEAAFVTIIPSIIFSYAKNKAGSWISLFYMMLPLGTCLGYLMAPILSMANITIPQIYATSCFILIGLSLVCSLFNEKILKRNEYERMNRENANILKDKDGNLEHDDSSTNQNSEKLNDQKNNTENNLNITTPSKDNSDNKYLEIELDNCDEALKDDKTKSDIYSLLRTNLSNVSFLLAVVSYTAHLALMSCHLVYGPTILYSYGVYPSYKISVIVCSLVACISAIVGTISGGYLVDYCNLNIHDIDKNYEHIKNDDTINKLYKKDFVVYKFIKSVSLALLLVATVSTVFMMTIPFVSNKYIYTAMLFVGYTALFALSPGENIVIMVTSPKSIRPFAVGLSTFLAHMFGDIPWTVIIGKIKGTLAPDCVVTVNSEITDACRSQYSGLLITLMIVSSKTIIITLGMASLYFYSKRKMIRYKNLRAVS